MRRLRDVEAKLSHAVTLALITFLCLYSAFIVRFVLNEPIFI
jgi:hypothetical protein